MRRLVITSISPTHVNGDIQQRCVSSWVAADIGDVVTMNDPCEDIKVPSGCTRVDAPKSGKEVFKAPYVYITDMIDYARKNDYDSVMLINSDIELRDQRKVLGGYLDACERGLVIASRYNYKEGYIKAIREPYGIDVFIVHKNFYYLFYEAPFVMGQCWWDYWLPYRFGSNGHSIFNVSESIFYHKEHHVQYSEREWMRMFEVFNEYEKDSVSRNIGKLVYLKFSESKKNKFHRQVAKEYYMFSLKVLMFIKSKLIEL
jgi:hypothetical protein